ncbi:virulence-associated protein VapB [Limnohabitans sp.]|uniref:antitoxin n=1 Tax=Limnohabitans sp. TaxID=1907725 RepID=UPI0025BD5D00|nr:virulence-associated protein VapB [Limnohabitans sp.]
MKSNQTISGIEEKSTSEQTPGRPVRLFRNGVNQAVRIPKEFELPGKEAIMRKEGHRLVLEALPSKLRKGSPAALLSTLETLNELGPIHEALPTLSKGLG